MNFENLLLAVSYDLYSKKIDTLLPLKTILNIISKDIHIFLKIENIRNCKNSNKQKELKNNLPLFLPSINLSHYKKIESNEHVVSTGLIHFDVDIYNTEKNDMLFELLIKKIHSLVYLFRSPRKGLKFAMATKFIEKDKSKIRLDYSIIYEVIYHYLLQEIPEIKIDRATKSISQSCFFSSDPNLYVNFSPEIFPIDNLCLSADRIKGINKGARIQHTLSSTDDRERILNALSYIPVNLSYHERFKINMAIISVFGSEAMNILQRHWQLENPYKLNKDLESQINYAMSNSINIKVGTLFYYAKQFGLYH